MRINDLTYPSGHLIWEYKSRVMSSQEEYSDGAHSIPNYC